MIQTSFLVPEREDAEVGNGELHPVERWQKLEDDLYVEFEAFTLAPGTYCGVYKDPDTGQRVFDQSRKLYVAVDRVDLDRLRAFLKQVSKTFEQKCIYFEVAGEVELIWAQ